MAMSAHLGLSNSQFLCERCENYCPVICPLLGATYSFQTEVTRIFGEAKKALPHAPMTLSLNSPFVMRAPPAVASDGAEKQSCF